MVGLKPIIRTWVESPTQSLVSEGFLLYGVTMESGLLYLPNFYSNVAEFTEDDPPVAGYLVPLSAQRALNGEKESFLDKITTHRDYRLPSMESLALPYEIGRKNNTRLQWIAHWRLTGKLKQLAQAKLAGYSWEEYKKVSDDDGLYWDSDLTRFIVSRLYVSVEDFSAQFSESAYSSMFLYTKSIGDYFLCWVNNDEIYARRVVCNNKQLLASVNARLPYLGAKERQRYESYIFCTCDFYGDAFVAGTIDVVGNSLFYGWKPSWDGSVIAIVTHSRFNGEAVEGEITVYDPNRSILYLGSVTDTVDSETNELKITISIGIEKEEQWVPHAVSSPSIWIPFSGDPVNSEVWYSRDCAGVFSQDPFGVDVPLYCFFDADNRLIVVSCSIMNGTDPPFDSAAWLAENAKGAVPDGFDSGQSVTKDMDRVVMHISSYMVAPGRTQYATNKGDFTAFSTATIGTLTQSVSYSISFSEGVKCGNPVCTTTTGTLGLMAPVEIEWEPGSECPYSPPSETCRIYAQAHETEINLCLVYQDSVRTSPVLIIPKENAEAVYLLEYTAKVIHGSREHQSAFGIHSNIQPESGIVNYNTWNYIHWRGGQGAGCYLGQINYYADNGAFGQTEIDVRKFYIDRFGVEELAAEHQEVDRGEYISTSVDYLVYPFACGVSPYPFFSGLFVSMTSIEGLKFYLTNPGSRSSFSSNFERQAWENTAWQGSCFAGWQ